MKHYILSILLVITSIFVYGQKERKFIRQGNKVYNLAVENSDSTGIDSINFVNAEVDYRKALEKKPDDLKAQFNIGNALFKQQKMEEAASQFEQALSIAESKEDKAKAYFNYGNAMLGQQKMEESIEAYKNALRNDPKDLEAKYNLEFARKAKEQQDKQQQQQDKDKDKNKDKDKDKDKDKNKDKNKDKDKDDQKKDQDKDKQDQNKDQQDQKKEQQQQPKITKQNAEQMLKALQNDEQKTQAKVKKAKAEKAKTTKPEIDW